MFNTVVIVPGSLRSLELNKAFRQSRNDSSRVVKIKVVLLNTSSEKLAKWTQKMKSLPNRYNKLGQKRTY